MGKNYAREEHFSQQLSELQRANVDARRGIKYFRRRKCSGQNQFD